MIFSIYYINFPKVYEIKMMLSNKVLSEEQVEKQKGFEGEAFLKTKLGFGILDLFKIGDIEANGNIKGSGSKKVLETFEVKTTKSIILNEVVEKSKVITKFEDINEGELIRVDNVNLTLENEAELRIVKMFTNGSFKGMTVPGANGLDFTNLFNSMFKDYAYKMKGTVKSLDNEILVKIPVTFESEFESSYCVDDLFIGKVSLIGLYKGKINIDQLRNSFEFYKDLGELTNAQSLASHPDDEIQDSQYISGISTPYFVSSNDVGKEYYYIDLLAIIQNVNIPD